MRLRLKIKMLCRLKGITQEDLARCIDRDVSTVRAYLKEPSIPERHLTKIAEALGVQPEELMDDDFDLTPYQEKWLVVLDRCPEIYRGFLYRQAKAMSDGWREQEKDVEASNGSLGSN